MAEALRFLNAQQTYAAALRVFSCSGFCDLGSELAERLGGRDSDRDRNAELGKDLLPEGAAVGLLILDTADMQVKEGFVDRCLLDTVSHRR